jgi:hypothetical protein
VIISPKGRKSTTIVINVIQQLVCEGEQSPRALIIVEDKAKVLEMEAIFEKFERHTDLVVYGYMIAIWNMIKIIWWSRCVDRDKIS